mgnify:CR=1 FL=1
MRKFISSLSVIAVILILLPGCQGTVTSDGQTIISYEEFIQLAWEAFEGKDFPTAVTHFKDAKNVNVNRTEAYTGLGWSYLQLDSLVSALNEFAICASLNDPQANLHAGWAFALNAQKEYEKSNEQADEALHLDANWAFGHGLSIGVIQLQLLKAENYFLLGLFLESLTQVQLVNSTFTADVATDEGKAALSAEIERLKTGSES